MTQLLNVIRTTNERATPVVGDGVTICYYTDRHAGTVVAVGARGTTMEIQHDTATRTDVRAMSDAQTYHYARNLQGTQETARFTTDGWRIGGRRGLKVLVGVRDAHYDYSF